MKKFRIVFFVILIFSIAFYLFFSEGSMPFNKNDKSTKDFVIAQGESLTSIINRLEKEGIIRSRLVFYFIVKQMGFDKKIQAGDFSLSPSSNAFAIIQDLTHGTNDVRVTLIEGTRREEMAHIISQALNIPEVEIIKYSREGYLFPDTYFFQKDSSASSVVSTMEENFKKKFTSDLKQKISKNGLTQEEGIILASIVEREARLDSDRPIVAGILLKRLNTEGWSLQVDATIQYALGYQTQEKSWWKKYLTTDDLAIKSPYNSYKNPGLPPTPICNPGLASIAAVANAETTTPYWYYMSDKNGKMHFGKTIEEHNANIQRYPQ